MDKSDEELIRAWLERGDHGAFAQLYDRYESPLFRFLLSLGGDWDSAEDALQIAWMKALDNLPHFRGGSFKSWLFRIGHRVWLDRVRSAWERRRVSLNGSGEEDNEGLPLDERFADPGADLRETLASKEERERLRKAIEELPDQMRQTVLLRIDGELSYREIAETMGCPIGSALWRVAEAEKRLKLSLTESEVKGART